MTQTPAFTQAHSEASDGPTAAAEILDRLLPLPALAPGNAWLAFIYVTDALAGELADILDRLQQKTGISHWSGSVGLGVCAGRNEIFDRPGVAVLVAQFPDRSFCVVPTLTSGIAQLPADKRQWVQTRMPPFGIVHGDPSNRDIMDLIEGLSRDIENLALEVPGFLVGGLSASQQAFYQVADRVTEGGLSGVLFGPDVEVATALSQGCSPLGDTHRITDTRGGVILALDGRPALDVFRQDIGELLARDLARVDGYVHAALPVQGSDTGDYVVRSLLGIDPENSWLAIAGEVAVGDSVMFVRRDPKAAVEDLGRMAEGLKRRLPNAPRGGLYFSCVARGPGLFGREGAEMEILAETLGDVPLVGFFGNGEISNNRLYGYTGVLCLFV